MVGVEVGAAGLGESLGRQEVRVNPAMCDEREET
jgi:hypothetical protein